METDIELRDFCQIEFKKPNHILLKFFIIQKRLGTKVITEMRKTYPNITDDELVIKIIEILTNSKPNEYFKNLFKWDSRTDVEFWSNISRFWELFHSFHILYSQILKKR